MASRGATWCNMDQRRWLMRWVALVGKATHYRLPWVQLELRLVDSRGPCLNYLAPYTSHVPNRGTTRTSPVSASQLAGHLPLLLLRSEHWQYSRATDARALH